MLCVCYHKATWHEKLLLQCVIKVMANRDIIFITIAHASFCKITDLFWYHLVSLKVGL